MSKITLRLTQSAYVPLLSDLLTDWGILGVDILYIYINQEDFFFNVVEYNPLITNK